MGQQPERKLLVTPQKYACREEKKRLCEEANEEHDGRPGEGLSLHSKGAAALLHRKGESLLRRQTWHGLKRQM